MRLLFKDIHPRITKNGFKVARNVGFEGNYCLTNNYIKIGFNRLSEVVDFLNWIEGQKIPRSKDSTKQRERLNEYFEKYSK